MSFHNILVWVPTPLLALAAVLDALDLGVAGGDGGRRGRLLVGATVGVLLLTAFTGLGARRRLPAPVPGTPMAPWDVHANSAVVLLVPLLVLGVLRIRAVGSRWKNASGRLVLLDLALLALASAIVVTGLRIP